jgi:hypothetical protein
MSLEERVYKAHLAELKYCTDYINLPVVSRIPETEEGDRYKIALDTLSQPCNIKDKAFATLMCLLNREAMLDTLMYFFKLIRSGHPRYEASPVVVLGLELYGNRERYHELTEKYKYKNVKKFATDIRLKLSYFVDEIDNIEMFDITEDCLIKNVKNSILSENLPCNQLSKHIRPFSESVVDELKVFYSDESDFEKNIIQFEKYHQSERWTSVSGEKLPIRNNIDDDPFFCYSKHVIMKNFKPQHNNEGDKYHKLGLKLYNESRNMYERIAGLILMYFCHSNMERNLLEEYKMLQGRGNDMTLLTPTPFAFFYMYKSDFIVLEKILIGNGFTYSDLHDFNLMVYDFMENYFYAKGCSDYGIQIDTNLLSNRHDDEEALHKNQQFFVLRNVISHKKGAFRTRNQIINETYGLSMVIKGDYLKLPDKYTKGCCDIVNGFKFNSQVFGFLKK